MKKISIGLFTLIMAIGFAAFTTAKTAPAKKLDTNFYRYTPATVADPTDPEQYVWVEFATGCETGEDEICIINSPGPSGEGEHPEFTKGNDPRDNEEGVSVEALRSAEQ
jgi:hypothetical protein